MNQPVIFGTKSETLNNLRPWLTCSQVLPLVFFDVGQWLKAPDTCLAQVATLNVASVIVRSSARNEDGAQNSMAGAFVSCLNVVTTDKSSLVHAINEVISSFSGSPDDSNQVLVQPMLTNIQMSGVVMTHDLQQGAPYYTVNYDDESGLTDTITGGVGVQKTVLIARKADLSLLRSNRLRAVLQSCRELEQLFGDVPLDIEFAVDADEVVYVLQVRRISLFSRWHPVTERRVERQLSHVQQFLNEKLGDNPCVFGQRSILGCMPDWNPAEIIGATARPLASSLYRYLVTESVWRKARATMGYFHPQHQELMFVVGTHPYIDVRASFNSFLPADVDPSVAQKLVDAWIERLAKHTEWHDKVEFEIVPTCLDFCFDRDFAERYGELLNASELKQYRQSLSSLTSKLLLDTTNSSLSATLSRVNKLALTQQQRSVNPILADVRALLEQCRQKGTMDFSIIARHAFIAEALLRSACRRGALTQERVHEWKLSVHTVSTELTHDYAAVSSGKLEKETFLKRYGHLRPGTYDITSLRYDERADLFNTSYQHKPHSQNISQFFWEPSELAALQLLIDQEQWPLSAQGLLAYAEQAIAGREYAKFVFTRDLSDALAMLTIWGAANGLSRDDLSYIDINTLLRLHTEPLLDDIDRVLLDKVAEGQRLAEQGSLLKLGHLIKRAEEVFVIPLHRAMANFVTQATVDAELFILSSGAHVSQSLSGKIICIENADPGYDWIFTRDIAGLVTKFGGTNSHMAIRCAEFGIPAAIGCGEQLFERLTRGRRLELNCRDKTLTVV